MVMDRSGSHRCTSSWWKPSSQRKPRGKKLREGTPVTSSASSPYRACARLRSSSETGRPSGWRSGTGSDGSCTSDAPRKWEMPPSRLLTAKCTMPSSAARGGPGMRVRGS